MATHNKSNASATIGNVGDIVDANANPAGSVRLRGVTVSIDSDVGEVFVNDCARNTEGLLPDPEIKTKYELSDIEWEQLATNAPLLKAVRAERERRIFSGEAPREAAQRHLAKAPNVLNRILTDEQIAPRHRIEAARELRQTVSNGPDAASKAGEKVTITINLGADTLRFEETISASRPSSFEDGEAS
jgi:hypothetical protein